MIFRPHTHTEGLVASSQLLVSTRSGIPSELVEFNLIQAGGEVLCDKVRTGNPPPGGSTDTAQLHSAGSAHFFTMCALCTPERAECARCVGLPGVTDQPHQAFHSSPSRLLGTGTQYSGGGIRGTPGFGMPCPVRHNCSRLLPSTKNMVMMMEIVEITMAVMLVMRMSSHFLAQ